MHPVSHVIIILLGKGADDGFDYPYNYLPLQLVSL